MTENVDTSAEAVERLAAGLDKMFAPMKCTEAATLRAFAAEGRAS